MGRFVDREDRKQVTLRSECLDDFIAEDKSLPLHRLHELSRSSDLGQRPPDQFVSLSISGRRIFGHSNNRTHRPDDQVGRFDRISTGREYPVHVVPGRQPHIRMRRSISHVPSCRASTKSAALSANRHWNSSASQYRSQKTPQVSSRATTAALDAQRSYRARPVGDPLCYIARTQSSPLLLVSCSNKRGHSVELTMSACSSTEAGKRIDRYSMSRQTNPPA